MPFCPMIEGQEGITWEQWGRLAEVCETERAARPVHLRPLPVGGRPRAGWGAEEHRTHGLPFPRDTGRMAMLEGQVMAWCYVGAERLAEYAEAGVQRVFLTHELFDHLAMVELLAAEVLPRVP